MQSKQSIKRPPAAGVRRFVLVQIPLNKVLVLTASTAVGVMGVYFLTSSTAATFATTSEAEMGSLSVPDLKNSDSTASGGATVKFGPQGGAGDGKVVAVSTATQLAAALSAAKAGDRITLADGTYNGQFNSTKSGTAEAPITVIGSRNAIINGGTLDSGYTFSLGSKNSANTVSYWRLTGFSLTGGSKGIIFDNVQHSVIDNLLVQNTGQEGIHLRNFSSNNTIQNSTITNIGRVDQKYGEGLYVGTAYSNWSTTSQGKPDLSNNNQLIGNTISFTGAENIDIKETTHAGIIRDNKLDGSGMCYSSADCNYADSLIDMKGEGWTIANNTAKSVHTTWSGAENDAFQVHVISQGASEGSGNNNTFEGNTVSDIGGYGFNIQSKATGTIVKCNNKVSGAGKGFGNVTCK